MDKVTKNLAKQARAARLAKGMTQEDLAGRIEMATESVSHIERGVTVPSLKTLAAMADVLEISVADFFAGLTDQRAVSGSRMEQEARLRTLGRQLDDKRLAFVIDMAAAVKALP
jgi:transcriptional regulator with XRE-family HTH domain